MYRRSPHIMEAISKVCRDSALKIVLELPAFEFARVHYCISEITKLLRKIHSDLGTMDFVLQLDFSDQISNPATLSATSILKELRTGANIILVDDELKIVGIEQVVNTSQSELSLYSRSNSCCILHVFNGTEIVIYANGLSIKEMNVLKPLYGPTTRKKYSRSAQDYQLSMIDHYKQRIQYGGAYSEHWEDRANRILRKTPKKTERIFHDNLQNWLDENLNGVVVQGGVKKITDDETDIEIRVHGDSRFYIIEVKWLGYNGSTSYSESRLRDGITQVREYLQRDSFAFEACLAVYDGRVIDRFNELECINGEEEQWKEIDKCQSEVLPPRGKGMVFYLESKSASDK